MFFLSYLMSNSDDFLMWKLFDTIYPNDIKWFFTKVYNKSRFIDTKKNPKGIEE